MKYSYDLHIHTALSPCGDNDMTPNNIVNMSLINNLDIIAITDHNTAKNVEACLNVAKNTDLLVIPGMEVETSEEIHIVCLFPSLETALQMDKIVKEKLPPIKNKKQIFGDQLLLDSEDNVIGEEENLLVTATELSIYEVFDTVKKLGGVVIPAHIDRSSYSILSNLGFIPEDLGVNFVEVSKRTEAPRYLRNKGISNKFITSSDAHYLEDINENINFIELKEKKIEEVIAYFW